MTVYITGGWAAVKLLITTGNNKWEKKKSTHKHGSAEIKVCIIMAEQFRCCMCFNTDAFCHYWVKRVATHTSETILRYSVITVRLITKRILC